MCHGQSPRDRQGQDAEGRLREAAQPTMLTAMSPHPGSADETLEVEPSRVLAPSGRAVSRTSLESSQSASISDASPPPCPPNPRLARGIQCPIRARPAPRGPRAPASWGHERPESGSPTGSFRVHGRVARVYAEASPSRGGARPGAGSPGSVDNPRCVRMRWITAGSSIVASTTIRPPHRADRPARRLRPPQLILAHQTAPRGVSKKAKLTKPLAKRLLPSSPSPV
jgi:hypothetical protein